MALMLVYSRVRSPIMCYTTCITFKHIGIPIVCSTLGTALSYNRILAVVRDACTGLANVAVPSLRASRRGRRITWSWRGGGSLLGSRSIHCPPPSPPSTYNSPHRNPRDSGCARRISRHACSPLDGLNALSLSLHPRVSFPLRPTRRSPWIASYSYYVDTSMGFRFTVVNRCGWRVPVFPHSPCITPNRFNALRGHVTHAGLP